MSSKPVTNNTDVQPTSAKKGAGSLGFNMKSMLRDSISKGMRDEQAAVDSRLDQHETREGAALSLVKTGSEISSDVKVRIRIRLDECISNPFNPREFYHGEGIDALAVQLKRDGQYEAIKVTRLDRFPGKYVIIDGERRFRAKKSLGEEYIDAEEFPSLSDTELYRIASRINTERSAQTPFDDAVAWARLLEAKVYEDQDALAAAMDLTKGHVSKILSLNQIPMSLLRRMAENSETVGIGHAYNLGLIYKRKGIEFAEETLQRVLDGELSRKRLEDMVKANEEGASTPQFTKPHYAQRVKFESDGRSLGELKRFNDGRTELKLTGLSPEEQVVITTRLEAVMSEFLARRETTEQ